MPKELGTRRTDNVQRSRPETGSQTRTFNPDQGLSKNVTASLTFTAADGRATGAGGTFAAFAAGDPVKISLTNKNNGFFTVKSVDGAFAFIVLDPPPKDEGPLSTNIRTS